MGDRLARRYYYAGFMSALAWLNERDINFEAITSDSELDALFMFFLDEMVAKEEYEEMAQKAEAIEEEWIDAD